MLACEALATADSTAALLPSLDRELLDSFTLVYASRSPLADISARYPRAILFGRDARVVLTFTGDPRGADRDIVEAVHFRDDTRTFELERFVLPAAVRRDPALAVLAADNGEANPVDCLRCHGADPRPLYESYFVWPGFYGSVHDRLDDRERAMYRDFRAHARAPDSAYAPLAFGSDSEASPYQLATPERAATSAALAPNLRFGLALDELARARLARQIEAAPEYARVRDKLLAGLIGCEPMPVDAGDRARVRGELVAEDAAKLDRAGVVAAAQRADARMAELNSVDNVAELDYVARALDVGRTDWSLAPEPGARELYAGLLGGSEGGHDFYIKEGVLLELLRDAGVPAARAYVVAGRRGERLDFDAALAACSALAARARADHVSWPVAPPPPPAVASRCARCHEPGGEGPAIPFDRPQALADALAAHPQLAARIAARVAPALDAAHRMPRDQPPLDAAARGELGAYVASPLAPPP